MIVDVHAHYIPKNFSDFTGDISGLFELMEATGVEKQVLSPHWPPYLPDERECVRAVQMLNDGYADLARRYPEAYNATFAYIERLGLPQADVDKIVHHNAQALFGFSH